MWWEDKILRTFRVRLVQSPGVLGGLLAAIGDKRGNIGEIRTIHMGSESMVRDIIVFADDPAHLEALVAVVNRYPDAELLEVRDEVLEMHQGGKIAIRCRYRIDSMARSGASIRPAWPKSASRSRRTRPSPAASPPSAISWPSSPTGPPSSASGTSGPGRRCPSWRARPA